MHASIMNVLRQNRIYMTPHLFEQKDWDIIGLGFLLGIHMVQFPAKAAKEHVEKLIKYSDENPPTFFVTPAKVQVKEKSVYTRAHEVVCKRSDGPKLYQLLTQGKFCEPNHRILFLIPSNKQT